MPYIPLKDRKRFDYDISNLNKEINTSGELNYVISCLANSLVDRLGGRYDNHNTVIGVLECAKLEMYRRRTGPYEDNAIARNGDIQ